MIKGFNLSYKNADIAISDYSISVDGDFLTYIITQSLKKAKINLNSKNVINSCSKNVVNFCIDIEEVTSGYVLLSLCNNDTELVMDKTKNNLKRFSINLTNAILDKSIYSEENLDYLYLNGDSLESTLIKMLGAELDNAEFFKGNVTISMEIMPQTEEVFVSNFNKKESASESIEC